MRSEESYKDPICYQIRVCGHLNHHWEEWFDGLEISYEGSGITVFTGELADQSQLFGNLKKIRDLGLSLISLNQINRNKLMDSSADIIERNDIAIGEKLIFRPTILQEDRPVLIWLPDNYEESKINYPVLYHLDGYQELFHLAIGTLIYLSQWEESIPPLILVAISNTDRDRDLFPTRATLPTGETIGGGAARFIKFIERELIPFIDVQYRTLPNRILYGTSNSGLTAIYTLLTQSKFFDAYITSSPTLSWDNNYIFKQANEAFKNWASISKYLYMTCGKEDLGKICQENKDFGIMLVDVAPDSLAWVQKVSDEKLHCPFCSLHDGLLTLFNEWNYLGLE